MTANRAITLRAHCDACLDLAEQLLRDLGLLEEIGKPDLPPPLGGHDITVARSVPGGAAVADYYFSRTLTVHVIRTIARPSQHGRKALAASGADE